MTRKRYKALMAARYVPDGQPGGITIGDFFLRYNYLRACGKYPVSVSAGFFHGKERRQKRTVDLLGEKFQNRAGVGTPDGGTHP